MSDASHGLLRAKLRGTLTAIGDMSPAERQVPPSARYAEDYNRDRAAVEEFFPEVTRHLPPAAQIRAEPDGSTACVPAFAEFMSNYSALLHLVTEAENARYRKEHPPEPERRRRSFWDNDSSF